MSDDDTFRLYKGPGWVGVIMTSLVTSCSVLLAFVWALQQGMVQLPNIEIGAAATAAKSKPVAQEHVTVPPLLGLPSVTATELLSARGLRLVVREKRKDVAPAGSVIAQEPLADSMLPHDAQVVVVLSDGPPERVAIPDVSGKSIEEAQRILQAAGFAVEAPTNATPEQSVTATAPKTGESLERGASIQLLLSAAGIELPKLRGMPLGKAKKALTDLGLKVGKIRSRYDDYADTYTILDQTPAAGERVATGSAVDLVYCEE